MLINKASKATKRPWKRHLCCSECTACEAFCMTVHFGGGGGGGGGSNGSSRSVWLAFTDNEL